MSTSTKIVDLRQRYSEDIESWDWNNIKRSILQNISERDDNCGFEGMTYLGSVLNLMPSGKFYMPWTSNQTNADCIKDELYRDILEKTAEKHGCYITGSEGDGCDIMAAASFEDIEDVLRFADESLTSDNAYLTTYPGYWNDGSKPIAVADWNKITSVLRRSNPDAKYDLQNAVESAVESMGYVVEWEDNGLSCDDCGLFVATRPEYYGDTETAHIGDGYAVCPDCLRKDSSAYIQECVNNPDTAQKYLSDDTLEELGWTKLQDDLQSGFHPGQNDDGHKTTKQLRDAGETRDILFSIDDIGQFDVHFSVWVKEAE